MGDTVLRREWKKPTMVAPKATGDPFLDRNAEPEKDSIDLSFLLNLLDGTLEANGRILIITTNFPERIDRALIRPGRIDMIVNFKKCSRSIVQEMADSFFEAQVALPEDADLDGKWSPAEVNQILFRNFGNSEQAVRDLVEMTQADLYGFREEAVELSVATAPTG
jgi:SpoVK/Ycf46/Vps4 family AAA+-type ATPase